MDYDYGKTTHEWVKDNGRVDIFAYEVGEYHNGPKCIKCDYGFCHHCNDKPLEPNCPRRDD